MRTKTLSCAVMLALFPVVAMGACIKGGPFVCGGSVTINSMPQSENPIWTPPLASPSVTSSGILSAFYTSNMSQANPNSPQPVAPSCQYGGPGTGRLRKRKKSYVKLNRRLSGDVWRVGEPR